MNCNYLSDSSNTQPATHSSFSSFSSSSSAQQTVSRWIAKLKYHRIHIQWLWLYPSVAREREEELMWAQHDLNRIRVCWAILIYTTLNEFIAPIICSGRHRRVLNPVEWEVNRSIGDGWGRQNNKMEWWWFSKSLLWLVLKWPIFQITVSTLSTLSKFNIPNDRNRVAQKWIW